MVATNIVSWEEIKQRLGDIDVLEEMERAFVAYSDGHCVLPPVGELSFVNPPGDVHIKYGYVTDEPFYVVKIASGFYDNPRLGLSSSNGLMLLFQQKTGELAAVLLDEGRLTDIRTAAAGAVAAKYLAPPTVDGIGILGTGIQGRLQLQYLRGVVDCERVVLWGRDEGRRADCAAEMRTSGFTVETVATPGEVAATCNLLVTATPATTPLLNRADIRPGTHITAIGADTPTKQELAVEILRDCDHLVTDSREQCRERGEIAHALRSGAADLKSVLEIGSVIKSSRDLPLQRTPEQITVADLTGLAVQDVQIASAVVSSGR